MTDSSPETPLRRTLGFWRETLTGVGVILGAGVYALVGPVATQAGGAMWLAFLLAGLTAYSYARFARLRPKDSPEFQYTAMAFGPTAGFGAGWLMLAGDLLAAATVALGFGGYLTHVTGTPVALNALLLVVAATAQMLTGIGTSASPSCSPWWKRADCFSSSPSGCWRGHRASTS
jgi:APA family basic amino acid/polyamine antiporter